MFKTQPKTIGQVLKNFDPLKDKYISREFQMYGYDLAVELGDEKNKSLYIKLARDVPRAILERARYFVKDAPKARSRARLFMWKLKELRTGTKSTTGITLLRSGSVPGLQPGNGNITTEGQAGTTGTTSKKSDELTN